jgi:hypothetical protein
MANAPLSATGVNSYAKEHYNLTDDQAQAISAALSEARLNIAQTIVGNMEQSTHSPHAARTITYKPNHEIAKQFARDLHIQLTNIVSSEFADSGIHVLYHD